MTESESTESTISNANAWGMALVPLIATVVGFVMTSATFAPMVLPLVLVWQDRKSLKAYGIEDPPSFWWWLIPMVYLWKRANLLDGNKILAWVWLGAVIVGMGIEIVAGVEG
jgi:hypothetical protein